MDWKHLQQTMPRDKRLPDRAFRIAALEAVLDGRQYDGLQYPFSQEHMPGGEYVPLDKRRPSVRTGLCRVAVEDAVALLFSEGHWPTIKAENNAAMVALLKLSKAAKLNEVMLDAATRGSVGSVAIRFRVLKNKPYFDVMSTAYLTPSWKADEPDVLETVVEFYPVRGRDLAAMGYDGFKARAGELFWFRREWNETHELWFDPVAVINEDGSEKEPVFRVDDLRSVEHGLGFVPMVWVRNLPGGNHGVDGQCTFEVAIDTVIEADYLMSQGGRGLKYASDPTLVLKQGPGGDSEPIKGGAVNAIELPPEGDAKLLEINGRSSAAVLEHINQLRSMALESMHGNRSHADKLSVATSGRSIELMMAGLIWLADRMRTTYGEGALLSLLKMLCDASTVIEGGLIAYGGTYKDIDPEGLELRWAPWMAPMPRDLLETAQALVTAKDGGILSRESAVFRYSALIDIDDGNLEIARLETEEAETRKLAEEALKTGLKIEAQNSGDPGAARQSANAGKTLTRNSTA